ncbi:hypothetical protein [Halovenus sp. HT40]|uniref:hypothetical protein n=1 Tax=Halovenus sp. HT40 TaxID=3126691 RepID=UPI003FA543E4
MIFVDELADETVFTSCPPAVPRAVAAVNVPVTRCPGCRATYPQYEDDEFRETRVEQPPS